MGGKSGNEALERAFSSSLCTGLASGVTPLGPGPSPPGAPGVQEALGGKGQRGGKTQQKG